MDRKISLNGVHHEWEGCEQVRAHFRLRRRLFQNTEPGNFDPKCVVITAALNKHVLKPLLKRMGHGRQLYSIKMVDDSVDLEDDDEEDDDDLGDDPSGALREAADLSGEQLDELDRDLGLASGSESPSAAAMVKAVEPEPEDDPLADMLAEFPSPTDEAAAAVAESVEPESDPLAEMLAEFPSPTDEAAAARSAKSAEVVEVFESPMKVEPVSPERPKKLRKMHVFGDEGDLKKASDELARLKALQSQRAQKLKDAATALAATGQACLDNVETQMTDEQMMDGIAEKHRASTGSLDLASSPEPEQKLLDNDADKKPSNLPVVTRRDQMSLKASVKQRKEEKAAKIQADKLKNKGGSKANSEDKATPEGKSSNESEAEGKPTPEGESSKESELAGKSASKAKAKPVIWGSPEHKKRRKINQKATDEEAGTDAVDNASEANATVRYDTPVTKPKPKKAKVMKRPSAKAKIPKKADPKHPEDDEPPEDAHDVIHEPNPVMLKKTFARRFCPAGVWSQLKWITIRKAFGYKLYRKLDNPSKYEDKFFDACTVYLDTTSLPVCAETIEERIREAASQFLLEHGAP
ncbi:unnamed protein product [Symbiodinium necroappetens]|uniref:Uncharacterized protein n=1 Tax=Symbiodinium necroappetens TaxID=1628268 RepID=A0A812YX72_9DINO|nr:unnamed protein product [Symbiodinium necroappetens]